MAMDNIELDSFIIKFKSLWMSGYDASLCIETKLGYVNVNLNCKVGRQALPPFTPKCMSSPSNQKRSPSYFRRQERRRATRDLYNTTLSETDASAADQAVGKTDDQQGNVAPIESDPVKDTEVLDEAEKAVDGEMLDTADDVHSTKEVDQAELDRDKMVEELIVSSVTKPIELITDVEQEIRDRLSAFGIKVINMRSYGNARGMFNQSRVRTSPVNLKDVWGRRLGLRNCSVIEYFPPPPSK